MLNVLSSQLFLSEHTHTHPILLFNYPLIPDLLFATTMLAFALCLFYNHTARELTPPSPPLPLFGLFSTCCMVFKRGKMTGANACGNVGKCVIKTFKA